MIEKEILSFQDISDGYILKNDPLGIGSYTFNPRIQKIFFDNPSLKDYSKCMILFCRVDGNIAARSMFFPTRVKIGDTVITAQSGSSLYADPQYRHSAIGLDIMRYPIESKEYPFIVYAGISKMAVPMYKALRFNIFSFPEIWQPRRSEFALRKIGFKGGFLKFSSIIADCFIRPIIFIFNSLSKFKYKSLDVKKLERVPSWVNDIVNKDDHKFAEVHDQAWMQWTLDNNYFGKENEEQSFYEVSKGGKVLGFFMTKIRNLSLPEHNIDKVVFGTVYEWGTYDNQELCEYDIYKLAGLTLPKCVDIYNVATNNEDIIKQLKLSFMFRHGDAVIVTKDLSKQYPDAKDIGNWRIRFGYADVPFY